MKVILETKCLEAKGLEIAKERLEEHVVKATAIVEQEKEKGERCQ